MLKGLTIATIALAATFTIITYNMYLPISSEQNADFLEFIKHFGTDFYNDNQYVQEYIHKPIVRPIQAEIEESRAIFETGPRPLDDLYGEKRNVTLTFYVAYGNTKYLSDLLDMLDQYHIPKAVFFVEDRWAADHGYAIQRMKYMGYDVHSWKDLKHYDEEPYLPSSYKGVLLTQNNILSNVTKDRVGANFLNAALYNHAYGTPGSIVAFTPDIMSKHVMILSDILKQKDINWSNQAFNRSIVKTIPVDTITTDPIKIRDGDFTMESLHKNYPSIVKTVQDGYVIMDPIIIRKDASLTIKDTNVYLNTYSISNHSQPAFLRIMGKATIDNSLVASWDNTRNAINKDPYNPRGYIVVTNHGLLDVVNSTIAYLGYSLGGISDTRFAQAAMGYYDSDDFRIVNSTIAFNYYGFYSHNAKNFLIEDNDIYGNTGYGLDPHTGSINFAIIDNYVHDNGNQGIICSIDCYNVTITGNQVDYNVEGIGLHWDTNSSLIHDNLVRFNDKYGIFIQKTSYDNTIANNTLIGNKRGIGILETSGANNITDNVIQGTKTPIFVSDTSHKNEIERNSLQ